MTNHLKALATCVLVSAMAAAQAQTTQANSGTQKTTSGTTTRRTHRKAVARKPSVETQIKQLREDMETQIQSLKQQLADRDTQLQQAQSQAAAAAASAQQAQAQSSQQAQTLSENASAVSNLQGAVSDLKSSSTSLSTNVEQTQKQQADLKKAVENPDAVHYKGVTLSPTGSFIEAATVWRNRATGADIPMPFNATPLENTDQSKFTEFYGTGRQSRLALTAEGKLDSYTLRGYYEADWLGTGVTSNNNQSNSYVMRQRQLWAQAEMNNGWTFTAGQMWSLVTETKQGMTNKTEALPQTIDPNYNVGFNWERQYGARAVYSMRKKAWLGMAIENPQTLPIAGSGLPPNYLLGSAGAGGGLYNGGGAPGATSSGNLANYSYNLAPDVIAKVAFEPGWGHYEVYGLARFFRDRVYPNYKYTTVAGVTTITGSAAGAFNDRTVGGGIGGSMRAPTFRKKLDVGVKGLWGDGVGRYGTAQLSEATLRPNGQLALIHGYTALGTLELHATPRLDVYFNYGIEGTLRRYFIGAKGAQSGYGAYTVNSSGCGTEPAPAAGPTAGFSPGAQSNCGNNNRDIQEPTIGYWYDMYKGSKGRFRQSIQYSYIERQTWSGAGGLQPKGNDAELETAIRYYLP